MKIPQWSHPFFIRGRGTSDTNVLYEIAVHGEYEVLSGLDEPRTIIDGGANIGMTALYLLNRYPRARLVSVEPFAGAAAICNANLQPYSNRATLIQAGIWPTEGRLAIDRGNDDTTNRVRKPAADEPGATTAVTVESLIEMLGGSVDLLKLDVEGAEREIFASNASEWLPRVKNILIELHDQDCADIFLRALEPFHYEVFKQDSAALMVCFVRNLRPKQSDGSSDLRPLMAQ